MLDSHCHILPRVDDGAPDMACALAMLRAMHEGGIRDVVATPHWQSPYFEISPDVFATAYTALREVAEHELPGLRIHLGVEHHYSGVSQGAEFAGHARPCGDEGYVLIELPDTHVPVGFFDTCFELQRRGMLVAVAHVERCRPLLQEYRSELGAFVANGGRLQLTLGAMLRKHGWNAWWRARAWCAAFPDAVFLASDAHDMAVRRPRWSELPDRYRHLVPTRLADLLAH